MQVRFQGIVLGNELRVFPTGQKTLSNGVVVDQNSLALELFSRSKGDSLTITRRLDPSSPLEHELRMVEAGVSSGMSPGTLRDRAVGLLQKAFTSPDVVTIHRGRKRVADRDKETYLTKSVKQIMNKNSRLWLFEPVGIGYHTQSNEGVFAPLSKAQRVQLRVEAADPQTIWAKIKLEIDRMKLPPTAPAVPIQASVKYHRWWHIPFFAPSTASGGD